MATTKFDSGGQNSPPIGKRKHRQENQEIDFNWKGRIGQTVGGKCIRKKEEKKIKGAEAKFKKNVESKKNKRAEERRSRVKIRGSFLGLS